MVSQLHTHPSWRAPAFLGVCCTYPCSGPSLPELEHTLHKLTWNQQRTPIVAAILREENLSRVSQPVVVAARSKVRHLPQAGFPWTPEGPPAECPGEPFWDWGSPSHTLSNMVGVSALLGGGPATCLGCPCVCQSSPIS